MSTTLEPRPRHAPHAVAIPRLLMLMGFALLGGCAGHVDYTAPYAAQSLSNVKVIAKPRDAVWDAAVPALGREFFVINNLDKSSGLINLGYTGNPEKYVDCGQISSYVKNAAGERTYTFPGASVSQNYQIMDPRSGLYYVHRQMKLEGRMNLIFEAISPTSTRVTASTRYVVTRNQQVQRANAQIPTSFNDSISMNSGAGASFPSSGDGKALTCVPTGELEREVLSLIH